MRSRMDYLFNRTIEKTKRRYLRKNAPYPEQILWNYLRNRRLRSYKFKRQYSIGGFIVDFYCPELKLVIELDGDYHFIPQAIGYDKKRDQWIKSFGVKILRFTNQQVVHDLENVLGVITSYLP